MKRSLLTHCTLTFNETGTPVCQKFDDIYFSLQDGPAESNYVFLQGNQLAERFPQHARTRFVVAETGFGTGLNFLLLCQLFCQFYQQANQATIMQQLHVISCEKSPFSLPDLRQLYANWPQFDTFSDQLCQQWPQPIAGCHRIVLEKGRILLDLWLGDLPQLLPSLTAAIHQQVDSWFLDGFAHPITHISLIV